MSKAKYKTIYREGRRLDLALVARVAKVSEDKFSDCKVFNHKKLKILTPKQMLWRLPVALAQVKADKTSLFNCNQADHIFFLSSKINN